MSETKETLDKLYLEYSNLTTATTKKELYQQTQINALKEQLADTNQIIKETKEILTPYKSYEFVTSKTRLGNILIMLNNIERYQQKWSDKK